MLHFLAESLLFLIAMIAIAGPFIGLYFYLRKQQKNNPVTLTIDPSTPVTREEFYTWVALFGFVLLISGVLRL